MTTAIPLTVEDAAPDDVIRVDDLRVEFPMRSGAFSRRSIRAVDGVSLSLRKGETLGLVGESGCGKSSLVRTIVGINEPTSGTVEVLGSDVSRLTGRRRREVRRQIQLVFQDPSSSLDPRMTVEQIVAEPLRIGGRYSAEAVDEVLARVGIGSELAGRRVQQLSGGQRQRVGIGRALALEPSVLILDEPVSALDISIQAHILNLLQTIQEPNGLSYLFIGHDLAVIRQFTDRVAVMYLGRIVEIGTTEEVFGNPRHPYTRALLAASPVPDPRARGRSAAALLQGELPDASEPPSGCSFRSRCPVSREKCAMTVPLLAPTGGGQQRTACHFPQEGRLIPGPPSGDAFSAAIPRDEKELAR